MGYADRLKSEASEICSRVKADVSVQRTSHLLISHIVRKGRCINMRPSTLVALCVQVAGFVNGKFISNQLICGAYKKEIRKTVAFRGEEQVFTKSVSLKAKVLSRNLPEVFSLITSIRSNDMIVDFEQVKKIIRNKV